ncbi:hypothetical protein TB2_025565 [Malus domestica]
MKRDIPTSGSRISMLPCEGRRSCYHRPVQAFLKQPKVFISSKKSGKGKRPEKGGNRFWKSVGLGFKTPRDAIEGPPPTLLSLSLPSTYGLKLTRNALSLEMFLSGAASWLALAIVLRRIKQSSFEGIIYIISRNIRDMKRDIPTSGSRISMLPCEGRRSCYHRPVQVIYLSSFLTTCLRMPLSKSKRFNLLKVTPAGSSGTGRKAFAGI